jgi:hypothetical protein
MSLTRKLFIIRWLERNKAPEARRWRRHIASLVSVARTIQPRVTTLERRAALLEKIERLIKEANEKSRENTAEQGAEELTSASPGVDSSDT